MQRWEYQTRFIWAHIDTKGVKEYLHQKWSNWKPHKFSPETMIPDINALGREG